MYRKSKRVKVILLTTLLGRGVVSQRILHKQNTGSTARPALTGEIARAESKTTDENNH